MQKRMNSFIQGLEETLYIWLRFQGFKLKSHSHCNFYPYLFSKLQNLRGTD